MRDLLRPSLVLLAALTAITGLAYPLLVTGLAGALMPAAAGGSLLHDANGHVLGSALIGQPFTDPRHLWGRPSATVPAYDAGASTGSNLGPTSPALDSAVRARVAVLRDADPAAAAPVPADLVTASGSGLDPDISPAAAEFQVARIARARGVPADVVRAAIARHLAGRTWGILGEPRVNVLAVNLDLDQRSTTR